MRSAYKVPFVHRSVFFKHVNNRKINNVHSEIQSVLNRRKIKLPRYVIFWNKSSKVSNNDLIGRKVAIHNGKVYMFVTLKKWSVGFKLGQFAFTRRTVIHSSKSKQKKKLIATKGTIKGKGKGKGKGKEKIKIVKKRGKFNLTLKKFVGKKKVKKWA